jgi:CHAT domain-containing protein
MMYAYEDNDVETLYASFDAFIQESEKGDVDQGVVYLFASFLESLGESKSAKMYNDFIRKNTKKGDILYLLSEIYLNDFSGSVAVLNEMENNFDQYLDGLSETNKIIAILKVGAYLLPELTGEFYSRYSDLAYSSAKPIVKYSFMARLVFSSEELGRTESEIDALLDEMNNLGGMIYDVSRENRVLEYLPNAKIARARGDYDEYLRLTKVSIESAYGEFETAEKLLRMVEESPNKNTDKVESYASANLFQTRLGKGIEPVKYAFQLYEGIYSLGLRQKMYNLFRLKTGKNQKMGVNYQNILIVGVYLFEKTGDYKYLDRSLSLMDGYPGAGTLVWEKFREELRRDPQIISAFMDFQKMEESIISPVSNRSLRDVFRAEAEFKAAENEFLTKCSDLYESVWNASQIKVDALKEEMKKDTAGIVSYYTNEAILYRFFVSPDTIEVKIMNADRAKIMSLTEEVANLAPNRKNQEELNAKSYELYELLFNGIDSLLPPEVHIVATGELVNVPFASLRISGENEAPAYFGTEYAVSRQFSIGSMLALEELELSPKYARPLGLAPSFDNEFLAASELRQAGFALPPLRYGEEEVETLENRSAGKYLYGQSATLENYRKHAPDYGILHFATHAISSQMDGLRSRIYLLDGAGEPVSLYAGDIGDQTLNADLVVLSACETGGGSRHEVEGRIGLTKAFIAAGARAVVASDWAVDDYATAELMDAFYTATEKGLAPHKALQHARRSYLSNHPDAPVANWAAFEAYGGMVAPKWERQGGQSWQWLIFLGLGLAGAGFAFVWRGMKGASTV